MSKTINWYKQHLIMAFKLIIVTGLFVHILLGSVMLLANDIAEGMCTTTLDP